MDTVESKSRFSLNQKLIFSALIMIVAVVGIPLVYGIVEPHIKITMDALQSTKPLQIVDSSDTEVFSVDTDGTIFPPQLNWQDEQRLNDINVGKEVLYFEQQAESSASFSVVGGNFDQFTTLAEWRIDFSTTAQDTSFGVLPWVQLNDGILTSFTRVDDISQGNVILQYKNAQCPSWCNILFTGDDTANQWAGNMDTDFGGSICFRDDFNELDTCTLKLGWGNGDQTGVNPTQVQIKEVKLYAELILPSGATLTRVT